MNDKPCVKCGSTDRHPPRAGRSLGRCKRCRLEANQARKRNKGRVSPFECIVEGCTRRSRAVTKPSKCNSCYTRQFSDSSPKFPAQPLIDYMERHNKSWQSRTKPKNMISLERMDEICIDVLGVHPSVVYGDLYFKECVS